ncbi:DUF6105 family protein [Mesorhizobium sp. LHD-90]|uniref:DUF6105 family protein n=1 Tax=Mesorhizobium sp. LHD-90 TaxID=3071414 RepID=UPI0027E00114|nr:DUF6105 family protein [Mesorhizobium sp. LHD-90]MDQ6438134.1 DUF6105 family protein [Mesorhizobium sp. LHD-90]
MRYILTLWALPLIIFWGWFGLSYYDLNFGFLFLSRKVHDLYFQICGQIMGVDPATVPWFIAKALLFDTMILLAIWAFRRRRELAAWLRRQRERYSGQSAAPDAPSI